MSQPTLFEEGRACLLHTDPKSLLVAEVKGHKPWRLNCDELKKYIVAWKNPCRPQRYKGSRFIPLLLRPREVVTRDSILHARFRFSRDHVQRTRNPSPHHERAEKRLSAQTSWEMGSAESQDGWKSSRTELALPKNRVYHVVRLVLEAAGGVLRMTPAAFFYRAYTGMILGSSARQQSLRSRPSCGPMGFPHPGVHAMRVDFTCPLCRAIISAPESLAGESAPCPKCRGEVDHWPSPALAAASRSPVPAPTPASRATPPPIPAPAPKRWATRRYVLACVVLLAVLLLASTGWWLSHRGRADRTAAVVNEKVMTGDEKATDPKRQTIRGRISEVSQDMDSFVAGVLPPGAPPGMPAGMPPGAPPARPPGVRPILVLKLPGGVDACCQFAERPDAYEWMERFNPGQTVTIRGVVEFNSHGSMILEDCEVLADR